MSLDEACLRCQHPDHDGAECGALMGTFYGDDGTAEDDRCDCTSARALMLGGFLRSGRIWISNDTDEDATDMAW